MIDLVEELLRQARTLDRRALLWLLRMRGDRMCWTNGRAEARAEAFREVARELRQRAGDLADERALEDWFVECHERRVRSIERRARTSNLVRSDSGSVGQTAA